MAAPMGMTRRAASFAAADGDPPPVEVDVIDLKGDGLSDADAGLEHQPDDRLVAAVMERLADAMGGSDAGGDQGAQVVVGQRRDELLGLPGSLDPDERVDRQVSGADQPGDEAAHRELADADAAGCRAALEHVAHPGGHRGPGQGRLPRPGAPGQVRLEAVGVGVDRAGALGLGTQRLLPARQERTRVVDGELGELGEVVHAATTPRPRRPRPRPRISVECGCRRLRRLRLGPYPVMSSDRVPGSRPGSSMGAHEVASSACKASCRLSPDNPALSGPCSNPPGGSLVRLLAWAEALAAWAQGNGHLMGSAARPVGYHLGRCGWPPAVWPGGPRVSVV